MSLTVFRRGGFRDEIKGDITGKKGEVIRGIMSTRDRERTGDTIVLMLERRKNITKV